MLGFYHTFSNSPNPGAVPGCLFKGGGGANCLAYHCTDSETVTGGGGGVAPTHFFSTQKFVPNYNGVGVLSSPNM